MIQLRKDDLIEKFLVISLVGFSITTFFSAYDRGYFYFFSVLSLIVLLFWRYILKYISFNPLPKPLFIVSLLFILLTSASALMSDSQYWAFLFLRQYRFLILGGLLFTAPLRYSYRKHIVVIFFISAAIAGGIGILQYFGFAWASDRPSGFSGNAIIYAPILAVACTASIIMIFLPKTDLLFSKKEFYFLMIVAFLTLSGVILAQTRGAWLALFAASVITLFLYDRRKAFICFFSFVTLFVIIFLTSSALKQRAASIVTSFYTEDETGSTGSRLELWKGSLLIFKEHPVLGTGLGDFRSDIEKLISDKKLKQIVTTCHAHNIYLQVLATRGVIGLTLLGALFIFLMRWGIKRIRENPGIGGYVIVLSTLVIMINGLTANCIEDTQFVAASSLVIGLLGPFGVEASNQNSS